MTTRKSSQNTFGFGNFAAFSGKYIPSNSGRFAAFFGFLAALFLSGPLYAQTDYWFVLEKTAQKNTAAFQYMVTALASGNDAVAAVGYGESASVLFTPLPGNTPDLGALASKKLVSEIVKPISAAGLERAIALADEQAAAYGRSANRTLIIITTAATAGKTSLLVPANFESILYLALDAEPDPAVEAIADPGCVWQIASALTEEEAEAAGVYTLAEGLYNSTQKLAPAYKRIPVHADLVSFSLGNFFRQLIFQNRRTVILAANTAPDDVEILKEGKRMAAANRNRREAYTIIDFDNTGAGDFRLENSKIILAAGWQRVSPFAYFAGLGLIGVIALLVLMLLASAAKRKRREKKPVFQITYEINGLPSGYTVEICAKSNEKKGSLFGSGVSIKNILTHMEIEESKLNPRVVNDQYPFIERDKGKKETWFIRYAAINETYEDSFESVSENEDEGPPGLRNNGEAPVSANYESPAAEEDDPPPQDEQIVFTADNRFIVKQVFKKNAMNNGKEYQLVIIKL